jgi:hypothetical protein
MFMRTFIKILTALGFAVGLSTGPMACSSPRPSCYSPMPIKDAEGEGTGLEVYERLRVEAKALLAQQKNGLGSATVQKSADRIERELMDVEPRIAKLPRDRRQFARRLLDQTLEILDGIRERLNQTPT